MTPAARMWVGVGGGMESIPEHHRHGPADLDFPPPGGPWEALILNGRVVGWADEGGLRASRHSAELGQKLVEQHRDHLLGRLGHKLRSSVLTLQESAREAAFGRLELLRAVSEMGDPLLRLIVDTHLDGWLDATRPDGADIYLPAVRR